MEQNRKNGTENREITTRLQFYNMLTHLNDFKCIENGDTWADPINTQWMANYYLRVTGWRSKLIESMSAWRLLSSWTQGKGDWLSRDHLSMREGSDMFNRHVCLIKSGGGQGSPHNTLVSVLGGKSINFNGALLVSRNMSHYYASQILSAGINRQRLSLFNFFSWIYCIVVRTKQIELFSNVLLITLPWKRKKNAQLSVVSSFYTHIGTSHILCHLTASRSITLDKGKAGNTQCCFSHVPGLLHTHRYKMTSSLMRGWRETFTQVLIPYRHS